jgi:glycerol-3-phosphate dehydrogenase (NAD(P)+)
MMANKGLEVSFWGRSTALMQGIHSTRRNAGYLPNAILPESVQVCSDMRELGAAELSLLVVPTHGFPSTLELMLSSGYAARAGVLVSCAKGIALDTGKRMSELISDALPQAAVAVLSGPNHAEEVVQNQPTAAVIACQEDALGQQLQSLFTTPWFRSYRTTDVCGVEWAGALKNAYAIAAGIAEGLRLGDNAIAALVTRALAEMTRLGQRMGGQAETFYGLSGVGDLVATCFSAHSRNHRVGLALGQGMSLEEVLASTCMVAEGVKNTRSLFQCARRAQARTPLLDAVHAVLYEQRQPADVLRELFSRDAGRESE